MHSAHGNAHDLIMPAVARVPNRLVLSSVGWWLNLATLVHGTPAVHTRPPSTSDICGNGAMQTDTSVVVHTRAFANSCLVHLKPPKWVITSKCEINTHPTYVSCRISPSPQCQCSWTSASQVQRRCEISTHVYKPLWRSFVSTLK